LLYDGLFADVYFDDFQVAHTYSDIVAGGDYYPFGLTIEDRQITREPYRYGYQGQYAEKDKETGWHSFELRMYDARVGRWLGVDPMGSTAVRT
jgi:RHS repeat-associated protein